VFRDIAGLRVAIDRVDIGVLNEALQESFAGRMPAHQLLAAGIESFGLIEDGGVGGLFGLLHGAKHSRAGRPGEARSCACSAVAPKLSGRGKRWWHNPILSFDP